MKLQISALRVLAVPPRLYEREWKRQLPSPGCRTTFAPGGAGFTGTDEEDAEVETPLEDLDCPKARCPRWM
eukprot:CAMPEP_0178467014 /NCGR_PEP_ID=MMETSP0689_2-20121128/52199_1 /TAXON_ID=160604 /ORGANISM="Amphidinium massartii, Strain CS-259" /LENGTH=70 /DNA_ID=CAMNT_0020094053 /DNA_START=60 /DNA_END=269 /DNA_ORIENTATION=+